MTISQAAETWLESRALSVEIASRMGVYTGKRVANGEETQVVPDVHGDILVFPFIESDIEVGAKYRGRPRQDGSKVFWQRKDGKKTFFNADILDDPALIEGSQPLVIVEGEPDCLAVLTAGFPFCVSVPDGAPADKDAQGRPLPAVPESADDIDPLNDAKYAFIFNNWDRLQKIKRFVLFTDDDGPGRRLREELARRLSRVRCSFVIYPHLNGKKPDANEVLIQHGAAAVVDMIATARPFPIKGIYHLSDFPEIQRPVMVSTGWGRLDLPAPPGTAGLMLAPGFFMVVLGKPGSGKSTWTLQLIFNLARIHGWSIGLASFEVLPMPYVRDILRTHHIGKPRREWSRPERVAADDFIQEKFAFFYIDPRIDDSEQSLEWLIQKAEEAVIRDGIKVLLIDPWNELEHARRKEESETQYTARAIRALKKFSMSYDVLVIVVVHPTKTGGNKEQAELSLYDADGSAHWVNKPDIGIIIERNDERGCTIVHGRKFRFSFLGRKGETDFIYDHETETFSQ